MVCDYLDCGVVVMKILKSKQEENRIRQLERDVADLKKEDTELKNNKTVHLDNEQVESILKDLTSRIELSTNRIVDKSQKPITTSDKSERPDVFSFAIKCTIASFFFVAAIAVYYALCNAWDRLWNAGWENRVSLFIMAIAGVDCVFLGIDIFLEKDRNYIISLFSALVALVALVVTLVK